MADRAADQVEGFVDIDTLDEWAENYNQGDTEAIARSMLRFGFNGALRVRDGVVKAGNHSLQALRLLKLLGPDRALSELGFDPVTAADWFQWPPVNVQVSEDDQWSVRCVDISHLSDGESTAFAIADNRTSELATHDNERLAALLTQVKVQGGGLLEGAGYDPDQLNDLLHEVGALAQQDESDGSMLSLVGVVVDDPQHTVNNGDIVHLGDHVLICADVMQDWQRWMPYLKDNALFAPYAGPFLPMAQLPADAYCVIVQPDPYIAGHIVDQFARCHEDEPIRYEQH